MVREYIKRTSKRTFASKSLLIKPKKFIPRALSVCVQVFPSALAPFLAYFGQLFLQLLASFLAYFDKFSLQPLASFLAYFGHFSLQPWVPRGLR